MGYGNNAREAVEEEVEKTGNYHNTVRDLRIIMEG